MQHATHSSIRTTLGVVLAALLLTLGLTAPAQAGAGGSISYANTVGSPIPYDRPGITVRCMNGTVFSIARGGNSANACSGLSAVYVDAGWDVLCTTSLLIQFTKVFASTGWNQWPGSNHLFCWWDLD